MAIVGFDFTKLLVERKSAVKGKVNIKNNVSITSVEKATLSLGDSKQSGLRFTFEFTAAYEPNLGKILIEGEVLDLRNDEKFVDKVIADWKKEKKVEQTLMTTLLNSVLSKCNIQALLLSKEINLPPPVPLPKLGVNPTKVDAGKDK